MAIFLFAFRHMTFHDETKKYSCSVCSFTSRTSAHLKRHVRLHTGAKPFKCPYCDYKCNNMVSICSSERKTNISKCMLFRKIYVDIYYQLLNIQENVYMNASFASSQNVSEQTQLKTLKVI